MILFVYNDMDDPYYDARYLFLHTYVYAYVMFFVYFPSIYVCYNLISIITSQSLAAAAALL